MPTIRTPSWEPRCRPKDYATEHCLAGQLGHAAPCQLGWRRRRHGAGADGEPDFRPGNHRAYRRPEGQRCATLPQPSCYLGRVHLTERNAISIHDGAWLQDCQTIFASPCPSDARNGPCSPHLSTSPQHAIDVLLYPFITAYITTFWIISDLDIFLPAFAFFCQDLWDYTAPHG